MEFLGIKERKISIAKFIISLLIYIPFIVVLHLILGIGPGDIWDDLMKWCRKS